MSFKKSFTALEAVFLPYTASSVLPNLMSTIGSMIHGSDSVKRSSEVASMDCNKVDPLLGRQDKKINLSSGSI